MTLSAMKITNKQFIDIYLKDLPVVEVMSLLHVIKTLLMRHQIDLIHHMSASDEQIKALQTMIVVLDEKGKLNKIDVSSLLRMVSAGNSDDMKQFTLTGSIEHVKDAIEEALPENISLSVEQTSDVGMMLH